MICSEYITESINDNLKKVAKAIDGLIVDDNATTLLNKKE